MPSTQYQTSDYTAFAIETVLKRDWNDQITKEFPLLAAIYDQKQNWNKGAEVKGLKLLVPRMYSLVTGMTVNTAGIADANEIPGAWPTYDPTQGFDQAAFNLTHIGRPMTIKESERVVAGGTGGARGNLIDGKTNQLMLTFKTVISDMLAGSAADSRTSLMGLDYALSTANVVGGIDQSTDATWRAGINATTGTFSLPVIDNAKDLIQQNKSGLGDPDLLLLSYNAAAGGVNTYGKVRSQIAPAERIQNADFKAKYGFETFVYREMTCAQDNRGAANTAKMLTTASWGFYGSKTPTDKGEQRILGSDAVERFYNWWGALLCKQIRANYRWAGITG